MVIFSRYFGGNKCVVWTTPCVVVTYFFLLFAPPCDLDFSPLVVIVIRVFLLAEISAMEEKEEQIGNELEAIIAQRRRRVTSSYHKLKLLRI